MELQGNAIVGQGFWPGRHISYNPCFTYSHSIHTMNGADLVAIRPMVGGLYEIFGSMSATLWMTRKQD